MTAKILLVSIVALLAVVSGGFAVAELSDDSDALPSGSSSNPLSSFSTDAETLYYDIGSSNSKSYYISVGSSVSINSVEIDYGVGGEAFVHSVTEGYGLILFQASVSGTVNTAGTVSVVVGIDDATNKPLRTAVLHCISSGSGSSEDPIDYTTTAPVSGLSGSAYSYQVATNIPATFSKSGSWPSWLSMTSSGRVTGTCPTVSEETIYTAVIHAVSNSDSSNTADQTISIKVYPIARITAPVSTVSGVIGQPVNLSLSCNLTAVFTVSSGSLPDGITLNSSGVISGTPLAVADGTRATIKATTAFGPVQNPTIVLTFNIESDEDTLAITSTAPSGSYHGGNAIQFVFAANVPGSTFELIGAPSWLAISDNKVVGSVPNTYETATEVTWTLKATSPRGQTATQAASITCEKTIVFTTAPTAACVVIPLYDYNDDGSVDASVIDDLRGKLTSGKVSAFRFVFVGEDAETVEWDFGDGSTSEGFSVTHKYTKAGTYTVTCIATNPVGSDECTVEVTVDADLSDYLFYGIIGAIGIFVIAIVAKMCFGRRGSSGRSKRR